MGWCWMCGRAITRGRVCTDCRAEIVQLWNGAVEESPEARAWREQNERRDRGDYRPDLVWRDAGGED